MRKALLPLLLLAVAALLWWILQMGPGEQAEPESVTAPEEIAGLEEAELGDVDVPLDRVQPAAAPAFDNRMVKTGIGRHGLGGLVVDEAGEPVPGAWVAAYSAPFPLLDFEADFSEIFEKPLDFSLEPLASTFANQDGEFTLEGVPGRTLFVTARTRQRLTPRRQRVLPAELNDPQGVVLRTVAAASLGGRVVDAQGQPVAGAEVLVGPGVKYLIAAFRNRRFFLERVITAADGSFDVEAVPAGATLTVNGFDGPVRSGLAEFGPLAANSHGRVELRMDPIGGLSGKVMTPKEEPVSGAMVVAVPLDLRRVIPFVRDPEGWTAATTASGEYRFRELPEGLFLLLAQSREGRSAPVTARVSSERSLAPPLQVNPELSLEGRVVNSEGRPVPDALVKLQSIPSGSLDDLSEREMFNQPGGLLAQAAREILPELLPERTFDRTDATGRFRIPGWTNASLRVTAPGYVQADFKLNDLGEDKQPVLQIHQPGRVEGVVMDAVAKKPVPFYLVRGDRSGSTSTVRATVGGGGAGVIVQQELQAVDTGDEKEQDDPPPAWLKENEQLFQANTSWRARLKASALVDDDRGRFVLDGLAPGKWELTVQAEGYENGEVENVEVAAGKVTRGVVITLGHGSVVRGRVVSDGDGQPVPGAVVTVGRGEESGFLAMLQGLGDSIAMGETESDGSFEVRGIPAGSNYVNVLVDGYASASQKIPELQAFEERDGVEVRLELGGTVTGLVTDRNGIPLPGRMVGAASIQSRDFQQTATDGKGYYRMENLRQGSYFMVTADLADESVFAGDFATMLSSSRILTAYVADGQVTTVDIVDESAGGCRLTGQILDKGQPVPGANIVVFATETSGLLDFRMSTARTDEDGEFLFKSLAPGEYRAQVETDDWNGAIMFDVAEAPEDYVILEVPQGRVEGRVVEELTGAPVENAAVKLISEEDRGGLAAMFGEGADTEWASSEEDGRFVFAGVSPGRYHIEVTGQRSWSRDGDQPPNPLGTVETESFRVADGEVKDLDLVRLPAGGTILVRVVDGEGKPFERWFSMVAQAQDGTEEGDSENRGWGSKGQGYITGLRPGTYDVTVTARDYGTVTEEGIRVEAGQTAEFTVTMQRGVPLKMRVLDAQNRPVATSKVELMDRDGKVVNQDGGIGAAMARLFGGGGEQELGMYPPGVYTLRVVARDQTQEQVVTLVEGEEPVIEFRF